jgi:hypothetical protein
MRQKIKRGIIRLFRFLIKLEVIFIMFKILIIAYMINAHMPLEHILLISMGIGGSFWLIIQLKNRIERRHRFKSFPEPIRN